ncbi:MAG: hypothetical protein Q9192_008343, partial [Flavoplaca navasiana]
TSVGPNSRLGIPPGFTLNTEVLTRREPFNGGTLALVAVNALETLCFDLRIPGRIDGFWSDIAGSDIEMGLVSVEQPPYRFAAWAVQRTFEAAHRLDYVSLKSFIIWQGRTVGHILFAHKPPDASMRVSETAGDNQTLTIDDPSPPRAVNPAGLQAQHRLQLVPSYTGAVMPLYDVMLTILTVLVVSIEKGPDTPCENIVLPRFILRSERIMGRTVLTWGNVFKMMRILVRWLVGQDRYGELSFLIKRDGNPIAIGGIQLQ